MNEVGAVRRELAVEIEAKIDDCMEELQHKQWSFAAKMLQIARVRGTSPDAVLQYMRETGLLSSDEQSEPGI